ncbi:8-amino-7-oxononanoate synthase [Thermosynechococcus sp. CL-1]|uniref:8-amino-7-oxononanoate synthase n=1 Tax=unclassified Thermosynechococcus TaxID=2622553 RepID=UPI00122E0865|nr:MULTISPECIES: 8-amino-7-oxononanoate synthase [unclassified Thermosynechococcus]QEQ01910.1 8-amino-7-oxononanoate synthase [Thermosynechococcus sp. CL-1]WKT85072.1 8-amino-7-oxononanoate synthase [Thermosynechococcus sp. HY596]
MSDPFAWLEPALDALHRAHWYRQPLLSSAPGAVVSVGEPPRPLINFCSNDYLGLANHPQVKAAAIKAIDEWGTGATGSRLLSGQRCLHEQLERAIAQWKGTEAALVFSSGTAANLGTIAALVDQRDLVLGDAYNHACLKKGARLSRAVFYEYPHNNVAILAQLLETHRCQYRRCLILTDGVFSMDGDVAPLEEILALAEAYTAMVLVDDAHGTGVLGTNGAGTLAALKQSSSTVIQMGTLSKALGSLGGYIAGSQALITYLQHRASTWIYSTGLSPADTAAALAALEQLQAEPALRQALEERIQQLEEGLQELGCPVLPRPLPTPIFCLPAPDPATVLQWGQKLQEAGCWVAAVRPPTVPFSRLRITLRADHTSEHIAQLLAALGALLKGC